jgi:protein-tyrosine kinase
MPTPFTPRKHRLHPVLNDPLEVEDAREVTESSLKSAGEPTRVDSEPDSDLTANVAAIQAPKLSVIQRLRRVAGADSPANNDGKLNLAASEVNLPTGKGAEASPSARAPDASNRPQLEELKQADPVEVTDAMSSPLSDGRDDWQAAHRPPGVFQRLRARLPSWPRRAASASDNPQSSQAPDPTALPLSAFLEPDARMAVRAATDASLTSPAAATISDRDDSSTRPDAPEPKPEVPAPARPAVAAEHSPAQGRASRRNAWQSRAPEDSPSSIVPVDAADKPDFAATEMAGVEEALIGEILAKANDLDQTQVQAIVDYQASHSCKFGEAAVALGLVKVGDVMWALSRQYQYAVSPDDGEAARRFAKLDDELVVGKHPYSDAAEMVRDIRSQLLESVLNPDVSRKLAVAITSPNVGDGKSWLAANLALSLSQLGSRTLLIDADLRAPRLHRMFGLDDRLPGLGAMLAGRARPNVVRPIKSLRTLYLLPGGITPPNPLELVQGRLFSLLMKQLLSKFDHVVVDTPAAEHGADCRVIAGQCGAALIVGRRHRSSMAELQALSSKLTRGQTRLAGIVVNAN